MLENKDERMEEMEELQDTHKSHRSVRNLAKRGLTLGLCALLAGGIAFGGYEGVSAVAGNQKTVQAAPSHEVTLLKSEDTDDAEDDAEDEASTRTKGYLDVSDIVEEAMPTVVSITTISVEEVQDLFGYYGFYGFNGGGYEREVEGGGSGVIVGKNDDRLLIVTNSHVVEEATSVTITFADGESYEAKVNGYDPDKDIAIVSVAFDDLSDDTLDAIDIARIGSSDDLKVGEQILVIGNALGYGQSVTTGIVSAKNRQKSSLEEGVTLIQTDAAINPGNSGGAMLNMDGELVGISRSKDAGTLIEGMCFAIAISDVADSIEELMNEEPREKVENHGVLGIVASTVSEEAQKMYDVPAGVFVSEVTEGSGAEKAGIKEKSIITKFDGKSISDIQTLIEKLTYYEVGEEVELEIAVSEGGEYKTETVTVTLGDSAENKGSDEDDAEAKEAPEEDSQDKWGEGFQFGKPGWN